MNIYGFEYLIPILTIFTISEYSFIEYNDGHSEYYRIYVFKYYSIHIHNIIIILIRIWLIYHEYVRIWVSIIICDDISRIPCLLWTTSPQKVISHEPLRLTPRDLSQFCHPPNWQRSFLRIVLSTPDFTICSSMSRIRHCSFILGNISDICSSNIFVPQYIVVPRSSLCSVMSFL